MSRAGELFSRRFVLGAVLLIGAAGVLGGFLWLRDSSLVRVEHVKITGLTTRDAPAIRRTLRQAAMRMTTLHYDARALEQAVDAFPAVQSVSVVGRPPEDARDQGARAPSRRRARVRRRPPGRGCERRDPAAAQQARVASGGEGRLDPRAGPGSAGRRWKSAWCSCWRAPRRSCGRSSTAPTGPRTEFGSRCGPARRCGSARRARLAAKWAAVTRVLADASSGGASLLDVRLPERPAASFDGDPDPAEAPAPTAGPIQRRHRRNRGHRRDRGAARPRAPGTSAPAVVQPQP